MNAGTRNRLLVLIAISAAMLIPASPAFADVPSGLTFGASLGVVVVVGVAGLAVLVGVGVLVVKLIVRARRPSDEGAAAGPPKDDPGA